MNYEKEPPFVNLSIPEGQKINKYQMDRKQ